MGIRGVDAVEDEFKWWKMELMWSVGVYDGEHLAHALSRCGGVERLRAARGRCNDHFYGCVTQLYAHFGGGQCRVHRRDCQAQLGARQKHGSIVWMVGRDESNAVAACEAAAGEIFGQRLDAHGQLGEGALLASRTVYYSRSIAKRIPALHDRVGNVGCGRDRWELSSRARIAVRQAAEEASGRPLASWRSTHELGQRATHGMPRRFHVRKARFPTSTDTWSISANMWVGWLVP